MNYIEILESRIAPASLNGTTNTVTYQDVDGDNVTVKFSQPIFMNGNEATIMTFDSTFGTTSGQQLRLIDLSSLGIDGIGITVTASRGATGGDGFANVGRINGGAFDLGVIKIAGDLGQIDAGNSTTANSPGIKSLTVQSMGEFGDSTQGSGDLISSITGAIGSLTIKGSLRGAQIDVTAATDADAKISKLTIGDSIIGGATAGAGHISAEGDIGSVKIGGSIVGGTASGAGKLQTLGAMTSFTLGGSLQGGTLDSTGYVSAASFGAVKITGSVVGGAGSQSGFLDATSGAIASITVGGSILGGTAIDSGQIESDGNMGTVKITGDIRGGDASGNTTLFCSGFIYAGGRIASVTVNGSIYSGIDATSGTFTNNGAIAAHYDIGSLTVKGSLVGNTSYPVIISADGQETPSATKDLAIGKITVTGRVEYAQILGGFDDNGFSAFADNQHAQLGSITVKGDWIASTIATGAKNLGTDDMPFGMGLAADNVNFGDSHDVRIDMRTAIVSQIASITIKGQLRGTLDSVNPDDQFGFVAQQILNLKIGTTTYTLDASITDPSLALGTTGDFHLHEID